MAFKKGEPRHPNAGRKKGTPNRGADHLRDICEKHGVDVFEAMIMMAKDSKYEPSLRLGALKECAKYIYPQLKAVEVNMEGQVGFHVVIEDWTKKK